MKRTGIVILFLIAAVIFTGCQNNAGGTDNTEPSIEATYTANYPLGSGGTCTAKFFDNLTYTYTLTANGQSVIEAKGTFEKRSGDYSNGTLRITQTHKATNHELVETSHTTRDLTITNGTFHYDFVNNTTNQNYTYTKQ